MTNDLAYNIKKDIRNNPVFREADRRQKRELVRRVVWFVLAVTAVIFSARQQNALRLAGYSIEQLSAELEHERSVNRQLRLNLEMFESPKRVEEAARAIGLRPPRLSETLVLERTPATSPSHAIVARAE